MSQGRDDRFVAANIYWETGNLERAREAYLQLLEEYPESADLHARIGDIWRKLGSIEDAARHCRRAIELDPKLPWPHIGLGEIAAAAGQRKEAIEHFKRALTVAPHLAQVEARISALRPKISVRKRTRPHMRHEDFRARFQQANRLFDQQMYAEARAIYLDLLQNDPDSAALLCKLGEISALFGHFDEACTYLDRAERVDGSFPWSYVARAQILGARGAFDEAVQCLHRALEIDPSLKFLNEQIVELRARQARIRRRGLPVEIRTWPPANPALKAPSGDGRPSIAVVSWDLTHNPLGRAALLAELAAQHGDTDLVGALFPAFGTDLWEPLRDGLPRIPIRGFEAYDFKAFVEGAVRLVVDQPRDVVWVSKPRFPSLFIGFLQKMLHGAKVVCDVDDDELAFVGTDKVLTLREFIISARASDWQNPHNQRWTQLAQSMISWADAVTVCNPILQEKHGGTVVRHARDDSMFDPAKHDRAAIRTEFGFGAEDRVVLFLGTPRRHKGIIEVAEALAQIADPHAVLCIVGTISDPRLQEQLDRIDTIRKVLLPNQPLSKAAELNMMADVVCILQDPESPISASQTPAKITDALAMGSAIIATPVPPIEDLIERSDIVCSSKAEFVPTLKRLLSEHPGSERSRTLFQEELSYAANERRVGAVLAEASESSRDLPDEFMELLRHIGRNLPGTFPPELARHLRGTMQVGPRVGRLRSIKKDLNVVFFWKQNDSQLFGRRQDMLLAELSKQNRIGKILHIDAPISGDRLASMASPPTAPGANQENFVAANTVARVLRTCDEGKVHRRSFVYRSSRTTTLLGKELPELAAYPVQVEKWMRELSMMENTIAWVCPVAPQFPEVQEHLGFPFVVTDVIDDQRQWPMKPLWRAEVETNYRRTFAISDVTVANCQPVADWLASEGLSPVVVPNGLDARKDVDSWSDPPELTQLPRPIIGYAGNMTGRIEWSLIGDLAARRPDWTIVLIGMTPAGDHVRAVTDLPNVRALGVIPYESALRYLAALDAAIIPHAQTDMSDRMNPLKLYVYRSLGIPVVSTPVANIDDLRDEIRIADNSADFAAKLEEALEERRERGRILPARKHLEALSWDARLAEILARVDAVFKTRSAGGVDQAVA
ncbi:tetratricopeptide repeat-containing glycosyltransferase family protein [Microbaculum marinum]|uniref:Tetratricopeptide repeat-containing glycosyltransferase family protein n=1 Tax=Microbaculum marinum TaxID=1764581 RepID=A0AAW9RXM3_9HYPH